MTITFEHDGGVGMRATYRIRKDGEHVASMYRHGSRSGWRIYSVYYALTLGEGYQSIDRAKTVALTLDYPTVTEAYERTCAALLPQRRSAKEKEHLRDFVRLARELIAGSNSVREEIEKLVAEIDAHIIDRTDTRAKAQAECDRLREETGERTYTSTASAAYYPDPPSVAYPEETKESADA